MCWWCSRANHILPVCTTTTVRICQSYVLSEADEASCVFLHFKQCACVCVCVCFLQAAVISMIEATLETRSDNERVWQPFIHTTLLCAARLAEILTGNVFNVSNPSFVKGCRVHLLMGMTERMSWSTVVCVWGSWMSLRAPINHLPTWGQPAALILHWQSQCLTEACTHLPWWECLPCKWGPCL